MFNVRDLPSSIRLELVEAVVLGHIDEVMYELIA